MLIDYDKAGFTEYENLTHDLALKPDNSIFIVNLKKYKDGVKKTEHQTIESLVENEDMQQLDSWSSFQVNEVSKTIIANDFYNNVVSNSITLTQKTQSNFTRLFKTIILLIKTD